MSMRAPNGTPSLLAKAVRGVVGVCGVLLGLSVVVGSLMMRDFVSGHAGPNASPDGETTVFLVLGALIAVTSAVAASRPSRATVGLAVLSVLALVGAAGLL